MRPLRLRVTGFGDAKSSCLQDFRGTGPSSIVALRAAGGAAAELPLAAIAFALQGGEGQPGVASRQAEVELEFALGDDVLRIRRLGRKSGRARVTDALLWRRTGIEDEADEGELLARGAPDVERQLAELGLPVVAFQGACALPVARLVGLLDAPDGLEAALVEGVDAAACVALEEALERALEPIEEAADRLQTERREALSRATEVLEPGADVSLDVSDLGEVGEVLEARIGALDGSLDRLRDGLAKTRGLLEAAAEHQRRLDELAVATERLREVKARGAEVRGMKRERERALEAAALADREGELADPESLRAHEVAARALREVEAELAAAEAAAAEATAELEAERARESELADAREARRRLEELAPVARVLAATLRARGESGEKLRTAEAARDAAASELARAEATVAEARRARDEALDALGEEELAGLEGLRTRAAIAEEISTQARRLAEVINARKDVTKTHATTKIHLERSQRDLDRERRYLAHAEAQTETQAGLGPPEELASRQRRVAGLQADIERLSAEEAEQAEHVKRLGQDVLELRQRLGNEAYADLLLLQAKAEKARAALERAGTPAEELGRREAELARRVGAHEQLQRTLARAEQERAAAEAQQESEGGLVSELQERIPRSLRAEGAVEAAAAELATRIEAMESGRAAAEERATAAEKRLAACRGTHESAARKEHSARGRLEERHAALQAVVVEAGFKDLSDYQAAKRAPADVTELEDRIAAHEEELEEARAAERTARGHADVPVLREKDRVKWEAEEWERRQRERREKAQAERVHRDRDMLELLRDQLEGSVAEAEEERARFLARREALAACTAAVERVGSELAGLREQHAAAAGLSDMASGLEGGLGFARFVSESMLEETHVRAASWARRLSDSGLDLRLDAEGGRRLRLAETHGRGSWSLDELGGGRRFLVALALALGRAEAILLQRGGAPFEMVFLDAGPDGLEGEEREIALDCLMRLQASGTSVALPWVAADLPPGVSCVEVSSPTPQEAGR